MASAQPACAAGPTLGPGAAAAAAAAAARGVARDAHGMGGSSGASGSGSGPGAPAGPPPPPLPAEAWQQEYLQSLPEQQRLLSAAPPPWPLRVLRSTQLDALRLDEELLAMLREQFARVFALFRPGRVADLEPELNALLSLLIFRLSVWAGRATPGSELMNLRYRDERALAAAERAAAGAAAAGASGRGAGGGGKAAAPPWLRGGRTGVEGPGLSSSQRWLFGIGYIAIPYLWQRAHRFAARREWGSGGFGGGAGGGSDAGARAWRLLRWLEGAYKVGVVANLWLFLFEGKYRSLLERALGARLIYARPAMSRMISFEYLNRQLVWQELSEFLLFLLPLINVPRLKRAMMRIFPRLPLVAGGAGGGPGGAPQGWTVEAEEAAVPAAPAPAKEQARAKGAPAGGGSSGGGGVGGPEQEQERGRRTRRRVSWLDEQPAAAGQAAGSGGGGGDTNSDAGTGGEEEFEPPGPCPICGLREIAVPYVALPCRHVFCYFCLRGHCEADAAFECPVDGVRIGALRRYGGRAARGGRHGGGAAGAAAAAAAARAAR
ncbi:MAG: Pex12 amino terminal region-domain-containing protein [Monoraphidium minutum]|nr:MAG: Pex12 amino terminal region-domain-containing protein [Monoraphidium minutum]